MTAKQIQLAEAKRAILFGALWCIGGIIATAASDGHVLFWGAVLFGGIQFIKGLFQFLANDGLNSLNNTNTSNNYYSSSYKCSSCGKVNEEGSKFCISCGIKLSPDAASNPLQETLFGYAITLIVYVAKADGVVSKNEAAIISELLTYIADGNNTVRKALKAVCEEAKNSSNKNHRIITDKMIDVSSREFSNNDKLHFYRLFSRWLVMLVYADGSKNLQQNRIVKDIAQWLNVDTSYLNDLYHEFEQTKQEDTRHYQSENLTINQHYEILKCKPSKSDDEVKKAYREMAKQYHPDIISSKGLAEDFILFANQKFKEINAAYEAIKKHRGMK